MSALPHFLAAGAPAPKAEGAFGKLMKGKNLPPFMERFEQAAELGDAKVHPCSMAMDVMGAHKEDLLPFVGAPMGLTKFMSLADGGQCWSY